MSAAQRGFAVGIRFECVMAPETLVEYSQQAEQAGFDELWVVEDCFWGGGIASAATALASTGTIQVGLGIMPAVARNPAFVAMDIATLARLHPGRFLPGFGHGVADWMKQVGAFPASQLVALEEITTAVRGLLHGEEVTMQGGQVHLDHVKLGFPPKIVPPLALGVRATKSLAISGRAADGTLLTEGAAPVYVAWAREQIARGQREAGRSDHHRLTVYAWCSVDSDTNAARERVRQPLALTFQHDGAQVMLEPLGLLPQVKTMLAEGGVARLQAGMPSEWLDQLAVVGTPEECAASIRRLVDAGADSVVLVPIDESVSEIARVLGAL